MSDLGTDVHTPDLDIDPTFTLVSGSQMLAEAIARRIFTRRGTLLGSPGYGRDLRALVNGDDVDPAALASRVESEARADERVQTARATVTLTESTCIVALVGRGAAGPFALTATIDRLTGQVTL
jgi:hypothetical protein